MRVRQFKADGETVYAISDIVEILGYSGRAQYGGRKIILADVMAGDIVSVDNGNRGSGPHRITAVTRAGLAIILQDYPQLRGHVTLGLESD